MAEGLTSGVTPIKDEELLYRATEDGEIWRDDGVIKVGPEAFRDPCNRPSVDRAFLRGFDPNLTRDFVWRDRTRPDFGIVALFSFQVRQISPLPQTDSKGRTFDGPQIDIEHVPIPAKDGWNANNAHAEIFGTPHISAKGLFKRLKIRLSEEAEKNQDQILLPRNA